MKSELLSGIVTGTEAMKGPARRTPELSFRRLAEPAEDGILILDAETGRISAVNPFLIKLLGLPQSEMVGKTIGGLEPFKDIVSDEAVWEQLQKDGHIRYEDLLLKTSIGCKISVELVGNMYQIGDKKMILCIIRDVSGRGQAEAALCESEEKYRRLVGTTATGFVILDAKGRVLDANDEYARLAGYEKPEQILGRPVTDWTAASDRDRNAGEIQKCIANGFVRGLEVNYVHPDGTVVPIEINASTLGAGDDLKILTLCRDITGRQRAEAALRESETRLSSILESTGDGILAVDNTGRKVLKANRRFAEMWRIPQSRVDAGDNHSLMDFVREQMTDPDAFLKNESLYNSTATGMDTLEFKDGRIFESHAFPMMMDGVVSGRVWSFRDITGRKQAEEELKTILRTTMDGFYLVDTDGRFLDTNDAYCRMIGYSREELLKLAIKDIEAKETDEVIRKRMQQIMDEGSAQFETTHRRKDGSEIDIEASVTTLKDGNGKFVVFMRDITERKRAEDALRGSETLLKETQTIAGLGSYSMDIPAGLWRGSDMLDQIFGIDRTYECSVEGWKKLIHPDDRAVMADYLRNEVFDRGGAFDKEYRIIRHNDKAERWVHGLGRLEFDAQGRPVKMLGTIQDITERKRAMEELRNRETQLRLALDAARMGTWDWDIQTGHVFWSAGHEALWGYAPGTFPGTYEGYESRLHPDDVEGARRAGQRALDEHTNYEHEYRVRRPDGMERWIAASGQAFYGLDGKPMRMTGVAMDITERKRAAEALRHSQALYQSLVSQMPAGLFRKDHEGRYVVVNPVFCQLKDLSMEEIIGKNPKELEEYERAKEAAGQSKPPPRQLMLAAQGTDHHQRIMRTGETIKVEEAYPQPDGRVEYFHAVKTPVYDAEGRIIGSQGMQFDITEHKRTEKALQMFQFATNRAADAVFWMKRDGSFYYVNDEACRSLGYAREELMQLRLFDIDPDYSEEQWKRNWLQFDRNETATNRSESTHRRKDGSTYPVEIMTRHFSTDGIDVRVAFVRDITDRKRVEESQARLATAVEQAAESIVITDTKGTILYANPAFEKTSGYTRAEALGQNPRILKSGKQDAGFYRRMWEVLRRGEVWSGHFINRRKDGAFYEEEATISPVRDATGAMVNYVAVKRDVTREVQLEAQFRQAQKMEAVGQLASGVAHDFNNILNVIIGYGDLIASDLDPDTPLRTYAEELRTAAERAVGLTKQLLVFSRKQKVELVVLDLNETVTQLEKMLRRLIGENIELTIVAGKDTGHIKADAGYIGQVLMNLAVNARDAMPKGGKLTIATDNVTFDENFTRINAGTTPGDYVMLTVSDTGTGMTEEVKARIFEALFTTKPAGKGTGLGLATCQAIVHQSGGHIEVDTEVGKGTTFKVYFPRVDTPVKADDAPDQTGPMPCGTETLLVVEDEPSVRHLAWKILKALGYHVLRANNGHDALSLVHEYKGPPIRLVVTDVMMPVMGGRVMADWLKATYPDLKILFTSGYTDDAIAQEGVLEPGVAFLPKPYTPEVLARKVRAMLDNETDTSILRNPGAALNPPPPDSQGNP